MKKVETWLIALGITFLGVLFCRGVAKAWGKLSPKEKKEFKRGCIKDFKMACLLTAIIFIFLIITGRFP